MGPKGRSAVFLLRMDAVRDLGGEPIGPGRGAIVTGLWSRGSMLVEDCLVRVTRSSGRESLEVRKRPQD